MHSRKKAAPKDSAWLRDINPEDYPFGRHAILQTHEASGRRNLYIANHLHHLEYATPRSPNFVPTKEQPFERVPEPKSSTLIEALLEHATQSKYVVSVEWQQEGDLVAWDNTCVMHRAGEGTFMGKYKVRSLLNSKQRQHLTINQRDMRRTTVHDGSSLCFGYNERTTKRQGLP